MYRNTVPIIGTYVKRSVPESGASSGDGEANGFMQGIPKRERDLAKRALAAIGSNCQISGEARRTIRGQFSIQTNPSRLRYQLRAMRT